MKNIKKLLILPIFGLLITSCNSNNISSEVTSNTSNTLVSSTSEEQVDVRPNYQLEYETNILPYKEGDNITKDLSYGMTKYNVVSKALVNSNHNNTTWIQDISGSIADLPFKSIQETSYVSNTISYQESSLFSTTMNFGRKINAYYDGTNYAYGHSKERKTSLCLYNNSDSCSETLDVSLDDLEHVSKDYLDDTIGDFRKAENLFPINTYTIDENKSTITNTSDEYTITLFSKSYSIFANLISRFSLETQELFSQFGDSLSERPNLQIKYVITNDYTVKSISYSWIEDKINFTSSVSFSTTEATPNLTAYQGAVIKDLKEEENPFYEKVEDQLEKLLTTFVYQLANASQFYFPISIIVGTKNNETIDKLLEVTGNIEFQTSWRLSDFRNLDFDDPDQILALVLKSVSINLSLDINHYTEVTSTSKFVTSYDCSTRKGQYTYTSSENVDTTKDYDLTGINSFNVIIQYFQNLITDNKDEITQLKDNEYLNKVIENLAAEANKSLPTDEDESINYIDLYYYETLLTEDQYKETTSGSKLTSIEIDGTDSNLKTIYSSFLNENNPLDTLKVFVDTYYELNPTTEDKYVPTLDFTSLKYKFLISINDETDLLKEISLTTEISDASKTYSLSINIGEIKEMNSRADFTLNKYVK